MLISRAVEDARSRRVRSLLVAALTAAVAALLVLVSAPGAAQAAACPNARFRTGFSAKLPDCRAYEQVTSPRKLNREPFVRFGSSGGVPAEVQAAETGDAFGYIALVAFPDVPVDGLSYLSTRGASDWVSQHMTPSQWTGAGSLCANKLLPDMVGYSSDMSKGILLYGCDAGGTTPLVPGEPSDNINLYVRDNVAGTYQLVDVTPAGVTPANARYDAGSSDLSHVIFDEAAPLTTGAPPGDNLYEWVRGTVNLVTQIPTASAATCAGADCIPARGQLAGNAIGNNRDNTMGNVLHAVSADGSRIYFTAGGNLYLRQGASSTVQIDAPAAGAAGPGGGGQFLAASADGATVFFTDDASAGLTTDTVAGSGINLYEYNANGELSDLTPVNQANVQGLSGISDDGSYLYFIAKGSLASGAVAGQLNLYVWHDGTTTLVATLAGGDRDDFLGVNPFGQLTLTARVSANGRFIVFDSVKSLTGYDNTDANTGAPDDEIFLYDAMHGKLACASCVPDGGAPTAGTSIDPPASSLEGGPRYLKRYVSDSGQVFFDTAVALQPEDTSAPNDTVGRDVYEYEPDGAGSCRSTSENGGCVYLISRGAAITRSFYLDSTPDGSSVFFSATQGLVSQDSDEAYDIYGARVNGGLASQNEPPSSPSCQGDACKAPTAQPPTPSLPASVSFTGPGNVAAPSRSAAFGVADVTGRQRARLARGRRIGLRVRVSEAGRLRAVIHGRFRRAGHRAKVRRVAKAAKRARHGGTVRLRVRLSRAARRYLKHHRRLRVAVRVSYSKVQGAQRARFTLRHARRHHRRRARIRHRVGAAHQRGGRR